MPAIPALRAQSDAAEDPRIAKVETYYVLVDGRAQKTPEAFIPSQQGWQTLSHYFHEQLLAENAIYARPGGWSRLVSLAQIEGFFADQRKLVGDHKVIANDTLLTTVGAMDEALKQRFLEVDAAFAEHKPDAPCVVVHGTFHGWNHLSQPATKSDLEFWDVWVFDEQPAENSKVLHRISLISNTDGTAAVKS